MINPKKFISKKNILKSFIAVGLASSCFYFEGITTKTAVLANSLFEYRWDNDSNYKKLKLLQSSQRRMERSTYYFFFRGSDRKTGIIKLSLKFPKTFKAKLREKKIQLCKVHIGGFNSRTRCLEKIPSVIEISEDNRTIDIFPDTPIPATKKPYAIKLKMFNPRKAGMYQVNSFSQSPGELPISLYLGSYLLQIEG